ncbi:MAG: S-layer homology domain-containing protein [Acutalibacter sp.]
MKKLMSVLLALVLVLAMVPVAASAAEGDVELPDGYTQQVPADRMTTELVSGVTATVEDGAVAYTVDSKGDTSDWDQESGVGSTDTYTYVGLYINIPEGATSLEINDEGDAESMHPVDSAFLQNGKFQHWFPVANKVGDNNYSLFYGGREYTLLLDWQNAEGTSIQKEYVKVTRDLSAELAVAKVGDYTYETLKDAIAAAKENDTVTLLRDVDDAVGISVPEGKNFTLDFDNHTYILSGPGAGSTNTETNGFQLLKNSTITMKRGVVRIAENANNIKRIIQNYADLTLENMTFYSENQVGGEDYALSFNNGNVSFKGNTSIIMSDENAIAFDVCEFGSYPSAKVTFDENYTGEIGGTILYDADDSLTHSIKIKGDGTFKNIETTSKATNVANEAIVVSGGTFSGDVGPYLDSGKTQDEKGEVVPAEGTTYFSIYTPANMVVGQTLETGATLVGPSEGISDNVRIKIDVTKPEGSAPQIMATDTSGTQYNLAEVGYWGPETGFPLPPNYKATTPLVISFDKAGTYTATFSLVDATNQETVYASDTRTITVADAYKFEVSAPTTMTVGEMEDATATLIGDANAPSHTAYITVKVEGPDNSRPQILATDTAGNEYNLAETGNWGYPGFLVQAGYDITTNLTLSFDVAGTYTATFQLVKADDATVLGSGTASIRVNNPGGGGTPSEPEEPTWPFTDVTEGDDWFYDAVAYVYENGIMAGTGETVFEPTMELDRAMAAQLFYNLEGKPAVTGDSTFTDVTSGHWAVDAITWAAQNDIVAGIGGGLYDPDSNVTREQFAVILYKYARFKGYDLTATGDLTQFPDAGSISSWAETALSWANGNGLINGHENGTIDPKGSTIRAQAASIMANFDQNVAK